MEKMYFHNEDIKVLKNLNDNQLYALYNEVYQPFAELKRLIFGDPDTATQLRRLLEEIAKEVSNRHGWSPKSESMNVTYPTIDGITYVDTKKFKKWLRDNWHTACHDTTVFEKFSFWKDLHELWEVFV